MNDETGRFVYDRQVLVLVHETERDDGRLDGTWWLVLGKANSDALPSGEHPRSASGLSVDRDALVGHEAGSLGARQPKLIGEKTIQTLGLG
jgi:hypothetical protein